MATKKKYSGGHAFTPRILEILTNHFGADADDVFRNSSLLGYVNYKTRAANRGSKARGAFGNHYALYVVVEDYVKKGYFDGAVKGQYSGYEGAKFSDLFERQRKLPFGAKLQNHPLNSRLNEEFKKRYPTVEETPIVRDLKTQRYWIHEDLLQVSIRRQNGEEYIYNIAKAILDIIDLYVQNKRAAFERFLDTCRQVLKLGKQNSEKATQFVEEQLEPNVDARVFEIVSYAVLKAKYGQEVVWIGNTKETVAETGLVLYKTGRTNANDGGIDFVMKPLGRFFQVTETIDMNKYFLDIDKVQHFPITFVVKSTDSAEKIRATIREQAAEKYKIDAIVDEYMKAVEEIINVTDLKTMLMELIRADKLEELIAEIEMQSKIEFNYRPH